MIGESNRADMPVKAIGLAAVIFSAVYFVSDLIELSQGGFSTLQLALTYAAEAALPFFVIGLYLVQRPRIGALGLVGALTYAYTFVFFTGTVVDALIDHTADWSALQHAFGAWIAVHSVLMIVAGIAFGTAVVRAEVLPRWTGVTLIVGMVLMVATADLPDAAQTMSAGVRDLAFGAMGASLLRGQVSRSVNSPTEGEHRTSSLHPART
ncbi:MAG: conserved rane protein of unknown function [Ilumatobacteraceae bacterium]|nr:conserved rane protein of unknown function [Ilumatobacteraceae bacterium]